ncbi:MAG TPA: DUF5715 family protein [Vicinamibacterales bacterium]
MEAAAPREIDRALVRDVSNMLSGMRRASRRDALRIKDAYRPLMRSATFRDRDHLQRAFESGDLVTLPAPERVGIQPRTTGRSVIGGLDLEHQELYLTARPATMGMLLEIARRVQSGPIEVTSLVRSAAYQRALLGRNANASTDVPTHAMGYAVDIGLLFTPLETARELRDVLEEMRADGKIYFIGERAQLTFHVVPVPSRRAGFERAYTAGLLAAEAYELHGGELPGAATFEPGEIPPPPVEDEGPRFLSWLTELFD